MTSSQRAMWQALVSLTVVLAATGEVRAQDLEQPPAAEPAAKPATTTEPQASRDLMGFGASGQFVLSAERLFGYTWDDPSSGSNSSTFSVLAAPFGVAVNPYDWPRLGFDYFASNSFSGGLAVGFARTTTGNAAALNTFEVSPRIGYGTAVGPWLAVWPRAGITYVYASRSSVSQSYLGLTIDLAAVIQLSSHVAITFAPVANIGLTGKQGNTDMKYITLGVQFGLAIPF